MPLIPTTLFYFSAPVAKVTFHSYEMPWHLSGFSFADGPHSGWVRKMVNFMGPYSLALDDDGTSDEEFENLYSLHKISLEEDYRFQAGISIGLSDGTKVKPYIISGGSQDQLHWRDDGAVNALQFYRTNDVLGFLSNFSKHGIEMDGVFWPTVEHYYQSAKFRFSNPNILSAKTPFDAAKLGRQKSSLFRQDWEKVRFSIMLEALAAKFEQNSDIREMLLETQPNQLVEHTANDTYWADGENGAGLNMLGVALMRTRSLITIKG